MDVRMEEKVWPICIDCTERPVASRGFSAKGEQKFRKRCGRCMRAYYGGRAKAKQAAPTTPSPSTDASCTTPIIICGKLEARGSLSGEEGFGAACSQLPTSGGRDGEDGIARHTPNILPSLNLDTGVRCYEGDLCLVRSGEVGAPISPQDFSIQCDECKIWVHSQCAKITRKSQVTCKRWLCRSCDQSVEAEVYDILEFASLEEAKQAPLVTIHEAREYMPTMEIRGVNGAAKNKKCCPKRTAKSRKRKSASAPEGTFTDISLLTGRNPFIADLCAVCGFDTEEDNLIVYCEKCDLGVHQACYGNFDIPEGEWLCAPCSSGLNAAETPCAYCPLKGGALKRCSDGRRWAHVICALWVPELCFLNTVTMEPIAALGLRGQVAENLPKSRRERVCQVCKLPPRFGATIKCQKCKYSFHPTCGQLADGICMEMILTPDDAIMSVLCPRHAPKSNSSLAQIEPDPMNAVGITVKGSRAISWYSPSRRQYCVVDHTARSLAWYAEDTIAKIVMEYHQMKQEGEAKEREEKVEVQAHEKEEILVGEEDGEEEEDEEEIFHSGRDCGTPYSCCYPFMTRVRELDNGFGMKVEFIDPIMHHSGPMPTGARAMCEFDFGAHERALMFESEGHRVLESEQVAKQQEQTQHQLPKPAPVQPDGGEHEPFATTKEHSHTVSSSPFERDNWTSAKAAEFAKAEEPEGDNIDDIRLKVSSALNNVVGNAKLAQEIEKELWLDHAWNAVDYQHFSRRVHVQLRSPRNSLLLDAVRSGHVTPQQLVKFDIGTLNKMVDPMSQVFPVKGK